MQLAILSPILKPAVTAALAFWLSATSGFVRFDVVNACYATPCAEVSLAPTLPHRHVGETERVAYGFKIRVLDENLEVLEHEIGHLVLGLEYHAPPDMSIMSPNMGMRCFGDADRTRYMALYHRELKLLCNR